jgi:hypothetical protein
MGKMLDISMKSGYFVVYYVSRFPVAARMTRSRGCAKRTPRFSRIKKK